MKLAPPIGVGGSAPRRTRTTRKASGSRGFYATTAWQARSKAHLRANPLCVDCGDPARQADHDPPVRPDDREGVLHGPIFSRCWSCHSRRTRRQQGADGRLPPVHQPALRGCDINGRPRDPDHSWNKEAAGRTKFPQTKNASASGIGASATSLSNLRELP